VGERGGILRSITPEGSFIPWIFRSQNSAEEEQISWSKGSLTTRPILKESAQTSGELVSEGGIGVFCSKKRGGEN